MSGAIAELSAARPRAVIHQQGPRGARRSLSILGCRGIPGRHGGFETFAEDLAIHLTARGWDVTVYCQADEGSAVTEDDYQGIRRLHIPVRLGGAAGTVLFDLIATRHAAREASLILTLGYNTAALCGWYRLKGVPNVINMDGMEWRRTKYGRFAKAWLYLNERLALRFADHLVADHPAIEQYLSGGGKRGKISTIPYGATAVGDAPATLLRGLNLTPDGYALVIARPEPENSILEIVRAFSRQRRDAKLVVLGNYLAQGTSRYARGVADCAGPEIVFPGPAYSRSVVGALRRHTRLYLHGHTVGGTNPSLVEALAAGSAVLAHDNCYNRWVAGSGASFFRDEMELQDRLTGLLGDEQRLRAMREHSRSRHQEDFEHEHQLRRYEAILERYAATAAIA